MNALPHLEIIIGTMFSGKSTELIRRVNRYEIAGKTVQLFKPALDDRYSVEHVTSHDGLQKKVIYVKDFPDLLKKVNPQATVIGIDEVQFLESDVVPYLEGFVNEGGIGLASGLLKDFKDNFFHFKDGKMDMSELVQRADHMTYLKAVCTYKLGEEICGNEATRVQRLINGRVAPSDSPLIQVGGVEAYAPRCRQHFHFYK